MLSSVESLIGEFLDTNMVSRAASALVRTHQVRLAVYDLTGNPVWISSGDESSVMMPVSLADERLSGLFKAVRQSMAREEATDHSGSNFIMSPMLVEEGCVGMLLGVAPACADSDAVGVLLDSYAELFADSLAGRRTCADLTAELTDRYEELAFVYDMSETLDMSKGHDRSLDTICETAFETVRADYLAMEVPSLGISKVFCEDDASHAGLHVVSGRLGARVPAGQRTAVFNGVNEDSELGKGLNGFCHAAVTLLDVDGSPGLLTVFRAGRHMRFFAGDIKLLSAVGRQVSVFMSNRKVTLARRQLFDASVFGLARLAESRDPETGTHLERVREYSRLLAQHLKDAGECPDIATDEFVASIYRTSPLHDIGKVGIPDAILCKPGKLTPEEFDAMKKHCMIGGDTLRDIEQRLEWRGDTFLTVGKEIAYSHHEKWDGSGYPHGLAGDEIPLAARIMALSDVYDALTSKRCYKDAFSHEKARDIITEGSGSHFDPKVVAAFLVLEDPFVLTREQLQDQEPG